MHLHRPIAGSGLAVLATVLGLAGTGTPAARAEAWVRQPATTGTAAVAQPALQQPALQAQPQPAMTGTATSTTTGTGSPAAGAQPLPPVPPVAAQPAVPPNVADNLAGLDIGGLREAYSTTPSFIGDGNAPSTVSTTTVTVGRLMVLASDLQPGGGALVNPSVPAQINVLTEGQFNSVQAIQAAGYPSFVLPANGLGAVSGTPPTAIPSAGGPVGGITPVLSPGSYTAAVDETFATNPALNTSQYAGQNPTTSYDAAASGALPSGTGTQDAFLFYNYSIKVDTVALVPGLTVGFLKMVENSSPIPRDRVYFNYSYFHNANITPNRADINRFTPGFEKTFFEGWTSIEVRTPFAGTLSNVQEVSGGAGAVSEYRAVEFGNMSVIFKSFLVQRDTWGLTGGMQVLLPTAQSTFINGTNQLGQQTQFIYVENQSVHTLPFFGAIWAPSDRWFNQALIQVDVDTNGSPAYVNKNLQSGIAEKQLASAGRVLYPTFLYASFGTGYWLHKSDGSGLTGFSPVLEVHVNQGLTAFQPIQAYGYTLGRNLGVVSVTNGLVGCNLEWNKRSTVTFAYVTPLGGGVDRFFDGEFRAFVNWRFGPQTRITRAQF